MNAYAGIGGNRKLWDNVEVTAVEINPEIAAIYKDFFPDDTVIVGDAHKYILEHYSEFEFLWDSVPCQTHSSFRHNICVRFRDTPPKYPDMRLYQEILFLKHHFEGKWVVENVKPYYKPLIHGKLIQRHMFWSNFFIDGKDFQNDDIRTVQIPQLQEMHGFDLSKYKLQNKRQVLRNCVLPELGLHVLNCALEANGKQSLIVGE